MKAGIWWAMLISLCGAALAEDVPAPLGQVMGDLPFNVSDLTAKGLPAPAPPYHINDSGPLAKISCTRQEADPKLVDELTASYSGTGPYELQLLNLGEDIVSHLGTKRYALVGSVRYENVAKESYLEMWSYFGSPFPRKYPETGAYYTRALEQSGPFGKLEGTHDWREFWLPFDSASQPNALKNLVMNLHLTGPGTVHFRQFRLVQYPDLPASASTDSVAPPEQPKVETVTALTKENASGGVWPTPEDPNVLKLSSEIVPLWVIADPKITSTHFALVGEIRYDNASSGYLSICTEFAPESPGGLHTNFYTYTDADDGALQRIKGTSKWKPFWLPFDSSKLKMTTRLERISLSFRLADLGDVYVRNVKLIQYPDGVFPRSLAPSGSIPPPKLPSGEDAFQEIKAVPSAPLEPTSNVMSFTPQNYPPAISGIDWKSFGLGITATLFAIGFVGSFSFLWRRLKKRRNEKELRRIASLDS